LNVGRNIMLRKFGFALLLGLAVVGGCSDAPDVIEPTPAGAGAAGKGGATAAGGGGAAAGKGGGNAAGKAGGAAAGKGGGAGDADADAGADDTSS
jgi:hypothetical protein